MPLWLWGLTIGYLGVLLVAGLWAAVERTRYSIVERAGRLPDPEVASRLRS